MESSIIVFTRERLYMLFMCVGLFMLFIRESMFIDFTEDRLFMFSISSFRRVVNVVCFLLGNYPASGFCMPTFRNTLSVPSS
jgi:hypothetical protein